VAEFRFSSTAEPVNRTAVNRHQNRYRVFLPLPRDPFIPLFGFIRIRNREPAVATRGCLTLVLFI